MLNPADRAYFLLRAEAELQRGEKAASKCAADAHFELAGRYFDIAFGGPDDEEGPLLVPNVVAV